MQPARWGDDLIGLVDRLAARLPEVSRLRILDTVEAEWIRLGASAEPYLAPLVGPEGLWRLRLDVDLDVDPV